jgi:hypothetical protein
MGRNGKPGGKVDPETQVKQQRCLDLVVQGGFTYAEIAEQVGYAGESGARQAVDAILKRRAGEGAELVRPKMIARAEALWGRAWGAVLRADDAGDMDALVKAMSAADKALARLSKLHGLEGPDVSVVIGGDPAELERLKRDALALLDGSAGDVVEGEVVDSAPE